MAANGVAVAVDRDGKHGAPSPRVNHFHGVDPLNSPLLFDALYEKNFSLAAALIAENRGLHYVSAIHSTNTVLHIAVLNDAPMSLIKALVEKGLDVNKRNGMGRSPVYLAARHNCHVGVFKYLVEHGGEINCVDNWNYTPLMSAAYNGASLDMIKTLVELGADVHARDQLGQVAAHWAREGNHPEIVEYLEKVTASGVNAEATSQNASSPKRQDTKTEEEGEEKSSKKARTMEETQSPEKVSPEKGSPEKNNRTSPSKPVVEAPK